MPIADEEQWFEKIWKICEHTYFLHIELTSGAPLFDYERTSTFTVLSSFLAHAPISERAPLLEYRPPEVTVIYIT